MFNNKIQKSEPAQPSTGITKYKKAQGVGAAAALAAVGLRAVQAVAVANKAASEVALTAVGSIQKNAGLAASKGASGAKAAGAAVVKGAGLVAKGGAKAVGLAAKHPKGTAAVVGGIGAAVAAGAIAKTVVDRRSDASDSVGKTQGGTAKLVTLKDSSGEEVKILEVGGVYQSATYTKEDKRNDLPFETYRAFDVVFNESVPSERLLMIGGGGFAFPKHVLAHHPETTIDVLEPDLAVVKIAREHFFLSDTIKEFDPKGKRLHIIGKDGEGFLKFHAGVIRQAADADFKDMLIRKVKGANEPEILTYDSIINDAFSGKNACSELTVYGALCDAKACLTENGLYVLNVADSGADDEELKRAMDELGHVFRYVHVIPCHDESFGGESAAILVATDGEYAFPGETQVQKTDLATLDELDKFEAESEGSETEDEVEDVDACVEVVDQPETEPAEDQGVPGETIVSDQAQQAYKEGPKAKRSALGRIFKR